ncbi:MAG TPA: outer-membrane lipoprotein carrier protein LolA [Rhizomicrobium sp.]|nr:outer-membrane lipoprotein carrier protein LolA [Rhizomicrobium sp.]
MNRAFACLFAVVFAGSASARDFTGTDKTDLDRVSAALSAVHTLRAEFTQIGPDGKLDQGVVYIKKPGEMRFEYAAPSPTLVVCDGLDIAVFNRALHTVDRYPLSATPLNILLSDHANLGGSNAVTGIAHEPGALIVKARSNDRRATGDIAIVFSDPGLELRQWTITDAQGLITTVSLRNAQQGIDLPDSIFALRGNKTQP